MERAYEMSREVFRRRYLSVSLPNRKNEWFSLLFAVCAIIETIRGDANSAWHMFEMALLFEVLDRLPPAAHREL